MKNLFNCHSIGLHSFPISFENGLYKRIFYADTNHNMWKPFELAVHPHHVDIKITVLDGEIYNPIYEISNSSDPLAFLIKEFQWNSHILNGKGGFKYLREVHLKEISNISYKKGDVVEMKACELHTVQIERNKKAVWLIEETVPSCEYFPLNYSHEDLTMWDPSGLYIEVSDKVKNLYIEKYL